MNTQSLNRDFIKYIAIITMTFNHIAHILLTPGTLLYEVFEDIGYFTAITMCYFLVEGYHYTRSKKTYAKRLLIFAIIAQVPYHLAIGYSQLNMLFTLLVCFMILWIMENVKGGFKRKVLITSLTLFTLYCDWALLAALFTIWFEKSRSKQQSHATDFITAALLFGGFSFISYSVQYTTGAAVLHAFLSTLGIMASGIVLLVFYNGRKSERHQTIHKWFFYIYYPAHLLILDMIRSCL